MKAITLWRPWADWVADGHKPIETRTHKRFECLVGQRIAIHAARRWDREAITAAWHYLTTELREAINVIPRNRPSEFLATAYVADLRELSFFDSHQALIDCEKVVRYGLILEGVRKLQTPIPCNGWQGTWNVPPELVPKLEGA